MDEGFSEITGYADVGGSEPGELDIYCAHILSGEAQAKSEQDLGSGQTLYLCPECEKGMRDKIQNQLGSAVSFMIEQAALGNR